MAVHLTLQFVVRTPGSAWISLSRADARGHGPLVWGGEHAFDAAAAEREHRAIDRTAIRFVGARTSQGEAALEAHGRMLFDLMLPAPIKAVLRATEGALSVIATPGVAPWPLLHDGHAFLGRRWALGELAIGEAPPVSVSPGRSDRLLLVADPAADLPAARNEGELLFRGLAEGGPLACDLRLGRLRRADFLRIVKGYRLVHFAGHADAGGVDSTGWRMADGHLAPADLRAVAGGAAPELVFANACRSLSAATGALVDALLGLGVRHVIGTTVDLPDLPGADFARRFYQGLRDGVPVGEALRRARLAATDGVWAAYRLFGDPQAAYFRRPTAAQGAQGVRNGVVLAVRRPAPETADAEAWAEAVQSARARTRRVVTAHGGRLLPGRAVVDRAVFGLPITFENDAERAARAALALSAAEPEVTIALEAGPLVSTGLDVVGPAAAAVEAAAWTAPAGVWALAGVARGLRDTAVLGGQTGPAQALLRLSDRDGAADGPFVGRAAERARIGAVLGRVCAGQGRALTVVGPAGIGKSRLVEAALRDADGLRVLRGAARAYDEAHPLAAAADVIRALLNVEADASPAATGAALDACLRRLDADAGPVDLEAVLSIDALVAGDALGGLGDSRPALALALGLPDAHAQGPGEVPAAVTRLLVAAAREQPLLVVFEDLHWLAPAGQAVVEALVEGLAGSAVGVLATARPSLLDAAPRWLAHPHHEQLLLGPLPEAEAGDVLRSAAPQLGPAEVDALAERAEGNPLFLRELALARHEGAAGTPPPTVEAVIRGRLDRLPAPLLDVLRAASVLGRTFWGAGVAALLDRAADAALAALVRRRFISPASASALPDEGAWRFNHALTHEVVYHGIGGRGRAAWHGRAALWLTNELPGPPDARWARVAQHRAAAGDPARAAEAWLAAAAHASTGATPAEARAAFEAALAQDDAAGGALDADTRAEAETELAELLRGAGEWQAAAAVLDAALARTADLADRAERLRRRAELDESLGALAEARARLHTAAGLVPATSQTGLMIRRDEAWLAFRDGAYDEAVTTLDAALADVPADAHLLAGTVANALGVVHYSRGAYEPADRFYRRARAAFEAAGRADRLQAAYNNLGILAMRQGAFDDAARWFTRAVRLLARSGDRDGLARTYNNLGSLHGEQGAYDRAARYLRESIRIRERAGHGGLALGYANLGEVFLKQGQPGEARTHLERAIDLCETGKGPGYLLPDAYRMLAELHLAEADTAAAARAARSALALAERSGDPPRAGVAQRVLGEALAVEGDPAATAHLTAAVEILEALDQPLELGKAYAARARHGVAGAAEFDRARARELFDAVGATAELAAI